MTDEANLGAIIYATVDAGMSGYRVISRCARLPSGSLVLCQVLDLLFADPQLFPQHTAPSAAVSCCALPALSVDVQSFHIVLADIFIAQLGAANRSCEASSLYRMSFGIQPSSIRLTWPSSQACIVSAS